MEALIAFLTINMVLGIGLYFFRSTKELFFTTLTSLVGTNVIIITSDFFIR